MGDLSLPLPLLGTGVTFLAAFAGLAWKTKTCYFADLSVCGTQSVVDDNRNNEDGVAVLYFIHITRLQPGSDSIANCV